MTLQEDILFVKIQTALREGKSYYDSTRGNWKVSHQRIPHLKYVVGVSNKVIVCSYQVEQWHIVEAGEDENRLQFEGKETTFDFYHFLKNHEEFILNKFGVGSEKAYTSLEELETLAV